MLPSSFQEVYQNFREALKALQEAVRESDTAKQSAFAEVEHLFQTQVMILTEAGIDPEIVPRWRSIQTELHRMFKLLATDWLFLRSSRKTATSQQRIVVFCDRIEQMIGFCRILLGETGKRTDL